MSHTWIALIDGELTRVYNTGIFRDWDYLVERQDNAEQLYVHKNNLWAPFGIII